MTQTKKSTFSCTVCNDDEWIWNESTRSMSPCQCQESKRYKRILESSGISEVFQSKTVKEYKPKNAAQEKAKALVIDYITNFQTIRMDRNNSIAILGQPGSGKTHLTIATANALLKQGVGVLYMQYREVLTQLKQVINDDEEYQRQMNRFKSAPVLLIDDLFKGATRDGKINESEMRIMFELINHRYLKQLPILVSSEYPISKMVDYDDATGSRIAEMCKGRIEELKGKELNHRMEGL